MPYRDKRYRDRAVNALRDRRHTEGKCVQCGAPVATNPHTDEAYWLCDKSQNNCRGANNASKARCNLRKKEGSGHA